MDKKEQIGTLSKHLTDFFIKNRLPSSSFQARRLTIYLLNNGYIKHTCKREHIIEYNGKKKRISDWAREFNISVSCICNRLKRGMSVEDALNIPVRKRKNRRGKPVAQLTLDGQVIKIFKSVKEAANVIGCAPCSISNCINGRYNSVCGFRWKDLTTI